jgi:hypothetical protein
MEMPCGRVSLASPYGAYRLLHRSEEDCLWDLDGHGICARGGMRRGDCSRHWRYLRLLAPTWLAAQVLRVARCVARRALVDRDGTCVTRRLERRALVGQEPGAVPQGRALRSSFYTVSRGTGGGCAGSQGARSIPRGNESGQVARTWARGARWTVRANGKIKPVAARVSSRRDRRQNSPDAARAVALLPGAEGLEGRGLNPRHGNGRH